MDGVFQSRLFNPATSDTTTNIFVSVPLISHVNFESEASGKDLSSAFNSVENPNTNISTRVTNLDNKEYFYLNQDIQIFALAFRQKYTWYEVGITQSSKTIVHIPKTYFQLIWNGNGNSLNNPIDLSNLKLQSHSYYSYYFSVSNYWPKLGLSLGAKFKLFNGTIALQSQVIEGSLETVESDDYVYQNNLYLKTKTFVSGSSIDNLNNINVTDILFKKSLEFENLGIGIDLGAKWKINDKFRVSASATNLFADINYKSDVVEYTSELDYSFTGYEANSVGDIDYDDELNKISESVKHDSIFTHDFNLKIPSKFYADFMYSINSKNHFGITWMGEDNDTFRNFFSTYYYFTFREQFQFKVNYTIHEKSYNDISVAIATQFGPVQFYMGGSNIYGFWDPYKMSALRFVAGFNLVW